jgi:hypothetical protein
VALVAQVIGHLDLQARLQHVAHQRRQQPALAGQLDTLGPGRSTSSAAQSRSSPASGTPATLRGSAHVESPVEVMIVILSSPQHSVADPRITQPGRQAGAGLDSARKPEVADARQERRRVKRRSD